LAVALAVAINGVGTLKGGALRTSFELPGGADRADGIAFSADLNRMIAVHPSGRVVVWNLETDGPEIEWYTAPRTNTSWWQQRLDRVVWLGTSSQVLVASGDAITIHDAATGRLLRTLDPAPCNVRSLSVSADGRRAAALAVTGGLAPGLWFWDLTTGAILKQKTPSEVPIGVRRDQMTLLNSDRPPHRNQAVPAGTLKLIPGVKVRSMPAAEPFALNSTGAEFAANKGWGEVDLWNIETGEWRGYGLAPSGSMTSSTFASGLCYLSDGRLAAVFSHRDLAIYPTNTGPSTVLMKQMFTRAPEILEMHDLCVSTDGRRLAVGGIRVGSRPGVLDKTALVHDRPRNAEIQLWDVTTGKPLTRLKGPNGEVFGQVALGPDGRRLAGVSGFQFARTRTQVLQQSVAGTPGPLRVSVWELPEP